MRYEIRGNRCVITATDDKERYYTDSAFFYALKVAMQKAGLDVVKRLMYKDGHMVDDREYYVRDRTKQFCVWDSESATRAVYTAFNEHRTVNLTFVNWSE